jgi:hypothetical protein
MAPCGKNLLRREARKAEKCAEVHLVNGEYCAALRDFYTAYRRQKAIAERFFKPPGARLNAWADCVEVSFLALWVIQEGDLPRAERNKWRKRARNAKIAWSGEGGWLNSLADVHMTSHLDIATRAEKVYQSARASSVDAHYRALIDKLK